MSQVESNDAIGLCPQANPAGRTNGAVGRGQYDLAIVRDGKSVPVCAQRKAVPFAGTT